MNDRVTHRHSLRRTFARTSRGSAGRRRMVFVLCPVMAAGLGAVPVITTGSAEAGTLGLPKPVSACRRDWWPR